MSKKLVKLGTFILDYMEELGYSRKQLAEKMKMSQKYISELINAKTKLSVEVALKFEKVFKGTKAEFWLQIDNAYYVALERLKVESGSLYSLDKVNNDFSLSTLLKGLGLSLEEKVNELLNIHEVDSINQLYQKCDTFEYSYNFMQDNGDKKSIYNWIAICNKQIEIVNKIPNKFELKNLQNQDNLNELKYILYSKDFNNVLNELTDFCNDLGIYLIFNEAVTNSKVRGATGYYKDNPVIYLSSRFKRLDAIYFSFVHEIGHIIENENVNEKTININTEEITHNAFARDFFIEKKDYNQFISSGLFEPKNIVEFSSRCNVIEDILVGFLQHDKYVEMNQLTKYRTILKEGDLNVYSDFEK